MEDKLVGTGVKFERLRRITGYLVGTLDRFNDAKFAEVKDRVSHVSMKPFNKAKQYKMMLQVRRLFLQVKVSVVLAVSSFTN